MGPSDAARLKGLEDENRRLKKLLAESMLDNAVLKDLLSKNGERLRRGGKLPFAWWRIMVSRGVAPAG